MRLALALLLGCLIALAPAMTHAASIVKATYSHDGDVIALMVYTGPDGGPDSDPAAYWALLGKAPESAYEVRIMPDKAGGRTATLIKAAFKARDIRMMDLHSNNKRRESRP